MAMKPDALGERCPGPVEMVAHDGAANRSELASDLVFATRNQSNFEQRQSLVHSYGPVLEGRLSGMAIISCRDTGHIFLGVPAQKVLQSSRDWTGGAFDDGPVNFNWRMLAKLLAESGSRFAGPREWYRSRNRTVETAYNSEINIPWLVVLLLDVHPRGFEQAALVRASTLDNPFRRFVHNQQVIVFIENLRRMQVATPSRSCAKQIPGCPQLFQSTSRQEFPLRGQRLFQRESKLG